MPRYGPSDILLIAVFAACVSFQLLVPPSIGLADNGDSPKMIGRFSLGPENHDTSDGYRYFTARWVYDRNYFWISDNRSSELALIGGAVFISRCFSTQIFDICILGAIHPLFWIPCFSCFLPFFPPSRFQSPYPISISPLF